MSIISEALKKAEREREEELKIRPPTRTVLNPSAGKKEEPSGAAALESIPEEVASLEPDPSAETIQQAFRLKLKRKIRFQFPRLHPVVATSMAGIALAVVLMALLAVMWPGMTHQLSQINTEKAPAPELAVPAEPQLPFVLSGISDFGDGFYALVNGVIVQEGDFVDGATVQEISEGSVILSTRAGEIRLKIQA